MPPWSPLPPTDQLTCKSTSHGSPHRHRTHTSSMPFTPASGRADSRMAFLSPNPQSPRLAGLTGVHGHLICSDPSRKCGMHLWPFPSFSPPSFLLYSKPEKKKQVPGQLGMLQANTRWRAVWGISHSHHVIRSPCAIVKYTMT